MTGVYIWLTITVFAMIIEFLTTDMLSIWFAGGGLVGILLAALNVHWSIQVTAFIVVSIVLLLCFRKIVIKKFSKELVKTNADSAIGKEYRLLTPIDLNQAGTIKINDITWNVDTEEQKGKIEQGALVKIIAIKGNKYIVEEVK
jgi:membrane protein implicated in regulation of membrane protease activity